MDSYTPAAFPNFDTYYTQYPGYVNYDSANAADPNGGKAQQAKTAFSANPDPSVPTNIVGYSAGADTAVIQAKLNGSNVDKMVLLGPSFDAFAPASGKWGVPEFEKRIRELAVNTKILIYDDQGVAGGLYAIKNVTVISMPGNGHSTLPYSVFTQVAYFINYGILPKQP